ncbi:MAG TPA: DUF4625 domain-containing protein [Sphingobacterium sp.]|nr:DUF4625 domain-containing protein [Sphingobacterium sp.]
MIRTTNVLQKANIWVTQAGILVFSFVLLFSCVDRKGVYEVKIGEKRSSEAYVGQKMPVKAKIKLKENIAAIEVAITSADGGQWSFQRKYTAGYEGQNTATFAENIPISDNAQVGKYDILFKVIGENGTVEEENSSIQLVVDSTVPVIGPVDAGLNAAGDDLHLEAQIDAAKKIKKVTVIVRGEKWSKDLVFENDKIAGQVSYNFHEHVHMDDAPQGTYDVVLTVQDQEGRVVSSASKTFQKK